MSPQMTSSTVIWTVRPGHCESTGSKRAGSSSAGDGGALEVLPPATPWIRVRLGQARYRVIGTQGSTGISRSSVNSSTCRSCSVTSSVLLDKSVAVEVPK